MDVTEKSALDRLMEAHEELEMLVALLIAKHGEKTSGGYRIHIDGAEAFELRQRMGTVRPTVLKDYDMAEDRYVIDVL